MKTVQRGNKQLRVADDRLEDMLKAGYVEVDGKTGRILNAPAAADPAALKKENAALKAENAKLKKFSAELKAENKELRSQVEASSAQVEASSAQD